MVGCGIGSENRMTVGERIRDRRIELGITQAAAADRAGWLQGRWSDLEHDRTSPTVRTLEIVARVLRCTSSDLMR